MLSEKGCASPVPQFAHSVKWVHEVSYRVWGNVPTPECWWLLVTSLELGGGEGSLVGAGRKGDGSGRDPALGPIRHNLE